MSINSFFPPQRTLMGPGPSDVSPRVLSALARPTVGHLDPTFVGMMDEVKTLLQYAFQTKNALTMAVSAPGSAGMEACFVNLITPEDTVVVCVNGVFGMRMIENVHRIGAKLVVVEDEAAIWQVNYSNEINLWIELGQLDEKRLKKASNQAKAVKLYCYGASVNTWWSQVASNMMKFDRLTIEQFAPSTCEKLVNLLARNMDFQCSIQDGQLWLTSGNETMLIETITLK